MLIAGARLDATGWPIYCAGKEENADPYCTPWARQRMGAFSTTPNLSAPYRDRRVRAAAAVSPSYAMMFTPAPIPHLLPSSSLLPARPASELPFCCFVPRGRLSIPFSTRNAS